jgi:V-type H+-transporting ATPase subunit a
MFGDIGHGLVLLLFGLFLIKNSDTLGKGSLKVIFKLRFLFTLMGFFAFFCGLIYNDFLSIPWNLFGSCYK